MNRADLYHNSNDAQGMVASLDDDQAVDVLLQLSFHAGLPTKGINGESPELIRSELVHLLAKVPNLAESSAGQSVLVLGIAEQTRRLFLATLDWREKKTQGQTPSAAQYAELSSALARLGWLVPLCHHQKACDIAREMMHHANLAASGAAA